MSPPDGLKPMLEAMPKDDFGNEILYFNPARKGNRPFEVVSKGADGRSGTADDLTPR